MPPDPVPPVDPPHRRLTLKLEMEADDMTELWHALTVLANDLDHDEREQREITSGGFAAGYHLTLTCDPEQTGDEFREQLAEWNRQRQAAT